MYGIRTREDVTAAAGVLKDLAKLYEKEPQRIPVEMMLLLQPDQPAQLTVSDGAHTAVTAGEDPPRDPGAASSPWWASWCC